MPMRFGHTLYMHFPGTILWWRLGLANHHAHFHAIGHLLPLSLNCLLMRDLEEVVQVQDNK